MFHAPRTPLVALTVALLLAAGPLVVSRGEEEAAEPAAAGAKAAADLFAARCAECHVAPDPAFAVDRAWIDQVHRTA